MALVKETPGAATLPSTAAPVWNASIWRSNLRVDKIWTRIFMRPVMVGSGLRVRCPGRCFRKVRPLRLCARRTSWRVILPGGSGFQGMALSEVVFLRQYRAAMASYLVNRPVCMPKRGDHSLPEILATRSVQVARCPWPSSWRRPGGLVTKFFDRCRVHLPGAKRPAGRPTNVRRRA